MLKSQSVFFDPGTIAFNHAAHLSDYILGPNGRVKLECGDCHRPSAEANGPWKYSAPGLKLVSAAGNAGQGMHQKAAGVGEGDDEAKHQRRRQQIPAAGQQAACFNRDGRQDFHVRRASRAKGVETIMGVPDRRVRAAWQPI